VLRVVVGEPVRPILRSATRFVYTTMLTHSIGATCRYAASSSLGHARRLFGLER
jgi:hypothetical protein